MKLKMEVFEILEKAKEQGVYLDLEDGALVLNSTKKNIAPDLLKTLKEEKINIINYLKEYKNTEGLTTVFSEEKIKVYDRNQHVYIPLSFSQERLWFLDQLQGSLEYHQPFVFRLSGNLNKEALSLSLKEVVKRHEVLRTVIYSEEGVGYQKVLSSENWELSHKDLKSDNGLLKAELEAFLSIPFNLSSDFMFRSCLYDLGNKEYVLSGVFHHISSDGWSQGILINEFKSLYRSYVLGAAVALPDLSLQYIDYALWQRKYLTGKVIDDQLSYWEEKLTGVEVLKLPIDYTRTAIQSTAGSRLSLKLDKELSNSINDLSEKEGVTVFMALLTAFKVLLSKYSGQSDICVGTPVANRTQSELEGMIGFFVNTLALRSEVTKDVSFQELLQGVKQTTLSAYDHQQVPFEKVVERVVSTRDMGTSPLFQVMFVLQNTPDSGAVALEGVSLSRFKEKSSVASKFDLTMYVEEVGDIFSISIEYNTDLFKAITIERMATHYKELLLGVITNVDQKLGDLPMLSQSEAHELLHVFNNTEVAYPKDKTVVDLFEEQVKKNPDAIAVVFEREELSYQELDERSNQLAHYLREEGIEPDNLVGICLDRSLEMLVGILGILKSGGAYVPIDPEYPQDRIDYMLADANISLVLSKTLSSKALENKEGLSIVCLDSDWETISSYSTNKLEHILAPTNLAYVIYTSGSTGKPKGVMNEHKGIVNRLLWGQSHYGLESSDVILQKTSFSFDISVWELLWSITSGSKLVLAKPEGHKDALYLKNIIETHSITTIHFVPSMLQVFLNAINKGDCPSLVRVLCSGEALQVDQVNLFKEKFPGVRLDNLYGPTEAAIEVSSWEIPLEKPITNVLIGSPVANTSLYVLDTKEELVPIGVTGELCIGGVQVARGYLGKEALTREVFITHPFKEGERLYKTGDLARWLADGTIEYIGRKDDQVKIRGFRIELGEIENALSLVSGVLHGCVLAKEDDKGNKRLIGYVVLEEGALNKEFLQDQLKESLPDYMVPALWVELAEMPLTSNGKLNRKSLPDIDNSALSTKEYVAPRTETEEQLVTIWQDVLEVEKIGIHDNFFELGGHSLLIVRLISHIEDIGYSIDIQDVFSAPSISSMISKLKVKTSFYKVPPNGIVEGCEYITPPMLPLIDLNQEEIDTIMDQVPGGGINIQDIYPLSPLQEGIYFHHLMSDQTSGDPFVSPSLYRFSSLDKRTAFIDALNFIINRHDVLRTCVLSLGLSNAVQVVLRKVELSLIELSIDGGKEIFPQVEEEVSANKLWIDLTKAPMLEAKVADDVANDVYYLVFNFHHLMTDHVGLEKMIEEIALYLSGKEDNLSIPTLYRDFIAHTINTNKLEEGENYFSALFKGIEEPTYPFNLSNTMIDWSTNIASSKVLLSPALRDGIRDVSSKLYISPAVLFHAAFGLVVGKCSNTEHAIFGSLFLGRLQGSNASVNSLGLFINTLPILLNLKGNILEYVTHTKERLQEFLSYEQIPLSNIQQCSGISNDIAMFSALLNYRHSTKTTSTDTGFDFGLEVLLRNERTNYPLTLDVDDYGDDFNLVLKTVGNDMDAIRIISYVEEALSILLEGLNKEGKTAIKEVSIVPKTEAHELLHVFNNTEVAYPKDKTIVDLFEEQVQGTPNAIAVVFEKQALSYQELDERSNQLAHYLREEGIQTDSLVGICLDRSLEMLVGILGILKSGGAYVPIDPEYPEDRIDYMLADANISLVLSTATSSKVLENKEGLSIVCLDSDWETIAGYSTNKLEHILAPTNLAYVIYTSGSTGKPKGVMNEHKGIVNRLLWTQSHYGLESSDTILQKTSFSFDVSVWELLWSITSGSKLVFAKPEGHKDALYLKNIIETHSITTIHFVPSMLQVFLNAISKGDCSSLTRVLCSGEALQVDQVNLFKEKFTGVRLDNLYGPTEAAIDVSSWEVPLEKPVTNVLIGSPVANTSLYVLDAKQELVPIGVTGELCIGGAQVARGYLGKETLTKEVFIAHPFKEGERLYKTGDLARWLADGTIEYIGRKDNQVKIRGFRIELGEIENALSLVSGVLHSCVLAKEDDKGNKRLIGYVVLEEGSLNKEFLQAQLKGSLPEFMVPQLWVEMDEMPLTANGKLNRKVLPSPDSSVLSSKKYVAPSTTIEKQLVAIWQDVLEVEKIGIHDNFFELGGHSLLATSLISLIRKKMNIEIGVRDIFELTNIQQLGEYIKYISLKKDDDEEVLFEQTI